MAHNDRPAPRPKPTAAQLGVDLGVLEWQRSGSGDGSFEVAFVRGQAEPGASAGTEWVLLRVAGDPAGRVLVYDRIEWTSFLDGARKGEFDLGQPGAGSAA
jgi:Domain of unknown function (DUF397)